MAYDFWASCTRSVFRPRFAGGRFVAVFVFFFAGMPPVYRSATTRARPGATSCGCAFSSEFRNYPTLDRKWVKTYLDRTERNGAPDPGR